MSEVLQKYQRLAKDIVSKRKHCPEFPYFGASYPDACCIDGLLWDLDKCDENGQLYSGGDNPLCPFCHPEEFIQERFDSEADLNESLEYLRKILEKYSN